MGRLVLSTYVSTVRGISASLPDVNRVSTSGWGYQSLNSETLATLFPKLFEKASACENEAESESFVRGLGAVKGLDVWGVWTLAR